VETLVKVAFIKTASAMLAMAAAIAFGCHRQAASEAPVAGSAEFSMQLPTRSENWQSRTIPAPTSDAPIKAGRAPLVYMTETASTVRISDMTSGQELLPPLDVPARTLISVNSTSGITIGRSNVRRGSLPDDHDYGIFLVPSPFNEFRTGTVRDGRPPLPQVPAMPTSQPGGAP
jgi:hypothetical protein